METLSLTIRNSSITWKKLQVLASSEDNASSGDSESKDELAERLAMAEAEAAALRQELATRRGENDVDLSKLKPAKPAKRIDGTGFRETISGTGRPDQQIAKWGLSEADIFAPTDSNDKSGVQIPAFEEGADQIVQRRLLIGLGLGALTLAASLVKLPAQIGSPTKPLFFYLVPLVKLQKDLEALLAETSSSDLNFVKVQLRAIVGPTQELKGNLLNASALFESKKDEATELTFQILEYLDQADFSRYFENRGNPTETQKEEFLKFSLQSIKAASTGLKKLLSFAPTESLEAAQFQISQL